MINTWKNYQEELTLNTSFSPFELKENYTSFKINKKSNTTDRLVFLVESLKKEVMSGAIKQQKRKMKQLKNLYKQYLKMFMKIGINIGVLTIGCYPLSAFANTSNSNTFIMSNNSTPKINIDPSMIMEYGIIIALIIVAIGVALSMIMFGVAGVYLMLTKNQKATIEWNSNITKGLVQVLIAIPLVYAIFNLAMLVFPNLPLINNFYQK